MSAQLPTRKLGKNGPQVCALGFGTMGLSAFYGPPESDELRFKVLDRAYELGQNFWDTADMYQDSEDPLGKWFARTGNRDGIFLATKFSNKIHNGHWVIDSSPDYAREACEKSLQRLCVEAIDFEGKIKHIGLSEISSETLRRACKITHIDAVQIEYSPFTVDIEQPNIALLKTCRELGVAVIAYSPLGRGFMTGVYKSPDDFEDGDFHKHAPRFSKENFPKNLQLVDSLVDFATKKGCTPAQLTLAWLLAQGDDIFHIPGTKKIKYLEENLGALKVDLSKEEEREIRRLIEGADVHGGRYPEMMAASLFADTPGL